MPRERLDVLRGREGQRGDRDGHLYDLAAVGRCRQDREIPGQQEPTPCQAATVSLAAV